MMMRTMTMLAGGLLLCGALPTEQLSAAEPLKVTPAVRTVEAGDDGSTTTTVGWRHRRFGFYGGYWGAGSYWGSPFGGPFGGPFGSYYGVGYAPLSYGPYYHSSFYRPYGFGYYSAYRPVYVGSYSAYYGTPYIADYGSAVYAPPVYAAPVYATTCTRRRTTPRIRRSTRECTAATTAPAPRTTAATARVAAGRT